MSSSSSSPYRSYEPLPNATSIRVLLLAPGESDDTDVFCWLLPSDLGWDHERFPDTTPRPFKSFSVAEGKLAGGENRKFLLRFDVEFNSILMGSTKMHPFQRYEALSYVWGDPSDPRYIHLDGEKHPVTKNLYEALRSLRQPDAGRTLWIDALCINQSDYEEKKIQIGLMKRVYQQAEKVIAYLPLPVQDQNNIGDLVPKILKSSRLCAEDRKEMAGSSQGQHTGPLNSISSLASAEVVANESEPLSVTFSKQFQQDCQKHFLEDYGLPPEDSPLWASWRRLFSSPYFSRIWILQEISLAKNLQFWFGSAGVNAEGLIAAHHLLNSYTGSMNMTYLVPGHDSRTDLGDSFNTVYAGSINAYKMFSERMSASSSEPRGRLIEKLAMVTTFKATDPRDKIYALLGLTCDGTFFAQHVSYAPSASIEQTCMKFAKLFIERNEGIGALSQAGLRDEEDKWPSWVPHWNDLDPAVSPYAAKSLGKSSTRMRVNENGRTLHIPGVILDDIQAVNNSIFEGFEVSSNGASIGALIKSLGAGFSMVFQAFQAVHSPSDDLEPLLENLFNVVAQPKPLRKKSMSQDPKTEPPQDRVDGSGSGKDPSPAGPSSSTNDDEAGELHKNETPILRKGFHELLNYSMTLYEQPPDRSDHGSENRWQVTLMDSPSEYQSFLKRAMNKTAHRRLCITSSRNIGIVPKRAKVGDSVVMFEGSDLHFVLRRVKSLSEKGLGKGEEKYWFIGPAYFSMPESDGRPLAAVNQKFVIV